jgi:hypothetical protein
MIVLAVFASFGLLVIVIGGFVVTRLEIPLFMKEEETEQGRQAHMRRMLGLDLDGGDESDRYWQSD